LTADADPRHLAAALVAAHQGGTLLTYATGSAEPLRVVLNAAVDYVSSFRPRPLARRVDAATKEVLTARLWQAAFVTVAKLRGPCQMPTALDRFGITSPE
jgi:hypothetical protein